MSSTRSKLDEIAASFATLEDPRSEINLRHPLPSVLVIAVLAVLAGAAGPTAIARWANYKEDLLIGMLDLPHGVPAKDVFRRVLMLLKPDAFESAFNAWITRLRDEAVASTGVDRPIVSIDGKTARRSHDAQERPRRTPRRHRLGRRVRPGSGPGGLRREVQRDHRDPPTAQEDRRPGRDRHDRRDGRPEDDRRGGRPRQGRLRPGPEAEPRIAAPRRRRLHGRAARGGTRRGPGADAVDRGHGREEHRTYLQLPVPKNLPGKAAWKGLKSVGVVTSRCVGEARSRSRSATTSAAWGSTSTCSPAPCEATGRWRTPATGAST